MKENSFRSDLATRYVSLLDSQRGTATKLAKTIGKPPSFVSEIKRGNPVNALHLIAVSRLFGAEIMLQIMGIVENGGSAVVNLPERTEDLSTMLAEIEINSPEAMNTVEQYVHGVHAGAKASAKVWKNVGQSKIHAVNGK